MQKKNGANRTIIMVLLLAIVVGLNSIVICSDGFKICDLIKQIKKTEENLVLYRYLISTKYVGEVYLSGEYIEARWQRFTENQIIDKIDGYTKIKFFYLWDNKMIPIDITSIYYQNDCNSKFSKWIANEDIIWYDELWKDKKTEIEKRINLNDNR